MAESRRWSNTRILGACGLAAAVLGFVGAGIGTMWPRVGFGFAALAAFRKASGGDAP